MSFLPSRHHPQAGWRHAHHNCRRSPQHAPAAATDEKKARANAPTPRWLAFPARARQVSSPVGWRGKYTTRDACAPVLDATTTSGRQPPAYCWCDTHGSQCGFPALHAPQSAVFLRPRRQKAPPPAVLGGEVLVPLEDTKALREAQTHKETR